MNMKCLEYKWKCIRNAITLFLKTFYAKKSKFYSLLVTSLKIVFVNVAMWNKKEKNRARLERKTSFKIVRDIYLVTY